MTDAQGQSRLEQLLEKVKYEFLTREEELRTLQELDKRLVDRTLDKSSIYSFIIESICKLCKAEAAQVLIRNRDTLRIVASEPEEAIGKVLPIENCITGICVETKQPLVSGNINENEKLKNRFADILGAKLGKSISSELAVPMMLDEEVIGVLNAESPRKNAFDLHHEYVLSAFASQCAIAHSQVKLVDEIQLFRKVFNALSRDEADIIVPTIINEVLRNLDDYIGEVKHYQILFVQHDELIIAFSSLGLDVGARVTTYDSVSGRAVREKTTQIVYDVEKDPDYRRVLDAHIRSEMAVPIDVEGTIVGVINLESEQLSFFDSFSNIIVTRFSHQIQWIIILLRFKYENDAIIRHGKAMEIMHAIGSQTSNLIHTLNNDLMPARWAYQKIIEECEPILNQNPILKEQLDKIYNSIENASEIPVEMSKLFQMVEEVQIEESITDLVSTLKLKYPQILLETHICKGLPTIRCRSFSGVISNLLRNASEATNSTGHIQLYVNLVELKALNERYIEIAVEDDGPGLRDDSERVFEWGYTTKKDKTGEGFGFGLAWSRALVESEGGRITAENIEEGGARFKVRYPIDYH